MKRLPKATIIGFLLLLVIPTAVVIRVSHSLDVRIIVGFLAAISLITFWNYWQDKKRAGTGEWRVPESTLHTLEILGGWPAAFLAQQLLRHKTIKHSFQIRFWSIVGAEQLLGFDYLFRWKFSHAFGTWFFSFFQT